MGKKKWLRELWDRLAEWIFPSGIYCVCCGDLIDSTRPYALCDACVRALHWTVGPVCSKCGKELAPSGKSTGSDTPNWSGHLLCEDCRVFSRRFQKGLSCVRYGLMERNLIHQLKYGGKAYVADSLSQIMYDRLCAEALPDWPDWIVPVPMHEKKRRKRGYNQAELLAEGISQLSDIPRINALMRRKETAAMSGLTGAERRENLKNVFTVCEKQVRIIENRTLLLIDDVYTTGTTADECAAALLSAGAGQVYVLVFASGTDRSVKR